MNTRKTTSTIALIAALAVSVFAQQYDPENDFEVKPEKNGITITKYIGEKRQARIPSVIQGLPVTRIGQQAFEDCASLISVSIPNSVTTARTGSSYVNSVVYLSCRVRYRWGEVHHKR